MVLKKSVKNVGHNFISFVLELDKYPETEFKCCTAIVNGDLFEMIYQGKKEFKLLSINNDHSLKLSVSLKKGTIIDES